MRRVIAAMADTLREIAGSRALWSTMVVAVLFYAFYYPAPYRHQTVSDLPIAVVDEEGSEATRRIVTRLDDTRELAVVARVANEAEGLRLVRDREVDGVLRLSSGLTGRIITGRGQGGISLQVNGAYLVRAQAVAGALEAVVREEVRDLSTRTGIEVDVELVVRPLFNKTRGYGDYIFPAVSIVILQQTLLFGAAMLAARRRALGREDRDGASFMGTLAALTLIGIVGALFYFGPVFWLLDMPRGGNNGALLVAVPLFSLCVAALGLAIGRLLDEGDRAMELLVPTSLVIFFLSGAAWPSEMMPSWVRLVAFFSPATHGVPLFLGLNQAGASLAEVSGPAWRLGGLSLLALMAAWPRRQGGQALLRP
ncbi:ABC transporter permease [Sphingomicrobium arenosum]|uniref:ABC transporter permease n=1 Tax=Sphingomicrobium arenosum TaxID=2233861 RepID=UPI002240911A|nr:ABC transporter permease [Sphingomicrobium arenosum]